MLLSVEHVEKSDCGRAFDVDGKAIEEISPSRETEFEPSPIPHIEVSAESLQTAFQLPPLPYKPSPQHRGLLPKFTYPPPEANAKSIGIDTFNRVFREPLVELQNASLFVLQTLYPSNAKHTFSTKTIEGTVPLIMRDMDGVAHTENSTSSSTSNGKKTFHFSSKFVFSTRYLSNLTKNGDIPFVMEVRGIMVHELTHTWQWTCNGTPGGLIEGIADFVRLRSGLAPKHWNKSTKGKRWDAGYDTTAFFLDWIDKEASHGFVARLNEWLGHELMNSGSYDEKRLFAALMPNSSWDSLWAKWSKISP